MTRHYTPHLAAIAAAEAALMAAVEAAHEGGSHAEQVFAEGYLRAVEDLPPIPDAEAIEDGDEARQRAITEEHKAWAREEAA